MEEKNSVERYIPPHRRNNANSLINFSSHAKDRQTQRHISSQAVEKAHKEGEKLVGSNAVTHIDESTMVITGKNGKVITARENRRNTRFDPLRYTSSREERLCHDLDRNPHNDHAMCELAELYLSEEVGDRKVKDAHDLLLKAATPKKQGKWKKGNSHAMCLLSQLYERGDLGAPNPEKAHEWLKKAADASNKFAMALIGQKCLMRFRVLPISEMDKKHAALEEAKDYFTKAANKGSTRAMWHLGSLYESGEYGTDDNKNTKNLAKAIEWYTKAAKEGSPNSLMSLNQLCKNGDISEEVFDEILETASDLIGRTSSELAVEIGLQQIEGKLGNNVKRGFYLLEQAANKRNVDAIKQLGKLYEEGRYCPQNSLIAQTWFKKLEAVYKEMAAEGNTEVLWKWGNLWLRGCLGKIDLKNAEALFIKSAEIEETQRWLNLATLYCRGQLGNKSLDKAKPWIQKDVDSYTQSALEDDKTAIIVLVHIYLDSTLGVKDKEKALKWLTTGTLTTNEISKLLSDEKLYKIGKLYEKNNPEAAIAYYDKAAFNGHLKACNRLKMLAPKVVLPEIKQKIIKQFLEKNNLNNNATAEKFLENENAVRWYDRAKEWHKGNEHHPKDILKAAHYYRKAANDNCLKAAFALAQLYESGELGQLVKPVAVSWYKQAAEHNHTASVKALISLYQKGFLVSANLKKENKWQEKEKKLQQKAVNFDV